VNLESYCRDIEAYLCRKNDGHLIRIAGPAFERVSQWADDGIPLKVAYAGIDRYFERYYRKGPRRRPVRIEFCEADVLDAFDDWRRAVGVALRPTADEEGPSRPRQSVSTHIERVIARLTALRASSQLTRPFDDTLERVTRQLDQLFAHAKGARGAARESLLTQLSALDDDLMQAAQVAADGGVRSSAVEEAQEQLAPFRDRMTAEAHQRATDAAVARAIRTHFGLPTITFS
jgi:hypothetical protein